MRQGPVRVRERLTGSDRDCRSGLEAARPAAAHRVCQRGACLLWGRRVRCIVCPIFCVLHAVCYIVHPICYMYTRCNYRLRHPKDPLEYACCNKSDPYLTCHATFTMLCNTYHAMQHLPCHMTSHLTCRVTCHGNASCKKKTCHIHRCGYPFMCGFSDLDAATRGAVLAEARSFETAANATRPEPCGPEAHPAASPPKCF